MMFCFPCGLTSKMQFGRARRAGSRNSEVRTESSINFFRTPGREATFLRGMHGFGLLSSPKVVDAFDLSGFGYG